MTLFEKALNKTVYTLRDMKKAKKRRRLKNTGFSIISSNCTGGVIAHDLKQQFRSPFINMLMYPKEYLKLLSDFDHYMQCSLSFIKEDGIAYPIGVLDDVRIYFMHYHSEEEAKEKWVERTKRINKDNLFILFADRDGCTYQDLETFDRLPFENKVVFTNHAYPEFASAYYIKGFENEPSVGICTNYLSEHSLKRPMDEFDYVAWLNGEKPKR